VRHMIPVIITSCMVLTGFGCGKDAPDETDKERAKPVQVGEVAVGAMARTLTAPGSVVAVRDVWISAEVGGRVLTKHATEGQRLYIEAGVLDEAQTTNLIATINPADYERLVTQTEAALKSAQAALQQYTATQKRLADDITRKRPLHEQKIISDKVWDDLVTRKEETDALVALNTARVDEARAALDIARSNLAKTSVRSPLPDALVAEVAFDQGEYVTPGQRLARVVNLDEMWVDIQIGQSRLGDITLGRNVSFTVATYPSETFAGTVKAISPAGDPASRSFLVRATVENKDHRLKGGMFAVVTVPINHREGVTIAPKSAVKQEGKFRYLFLVHKGRAVKQVVKLGLSSGDSVELTEGDIKPGDRIITVGVENLEDGDLIKIIGPAGAPSEPTQAD